MTIQISGKQVDVGDALRGKIQDRIADVVDKHFGRPSDGQVTIAREGSGFRADVSLHLASGVRLQAHGEGYEAHAAFEDALQKIEKRLRRYKRRLRDHHTAQRSHKVEQALAYVIQSPDTIDDEPEGDTGEPAPIIIAETRSEVKTLSVSAAVMKMDLAELPALLFRNAATDRLNVVYRRPDGHIGWIDPGVEAAVEAAS
jgi:ribosomal subunit interface protein